MLQDGKTSRTAAATDLEGLAAQFLALRDDLAKLTSSVAATAERRGRRMGADLSEGVDEAMQYVERKGLTADAEIAKAMKTHPFLILGLAAGVGLLIGALSRR